MNTLDRELDLPEYKSFAGELARLEDSKLSQGSSKRQELAAALLESNKQATRASILKDQDQLATWRPGHILTLSEFILKVSRITKNPKLNEYGAMNMTGLTVSIAGVHGEERKYVCAVPLGSMPEYSKIRTGKHGEAVNEQYRGWRTILLRLIEAGASTIEQVEKEFGQPTSFGSGPYLSQIRELRKTA